MEAPQSDLSANGSAERILVGVCVADPALRTRVCAALAHGGHRVAAREASANDLLAACEGLSLACVVAAARRADREMIEGLAKLRDALDAEASVLVCGRAGDMEVRRALAAGVQGIVLVEDVDRALAGVVSVSLAGQVSAPVVQGSQVRAQVLTTREKQILGLVVMGLSNGEIARKLYLAESTVKSHLSSAFSKLGVSSRNEATTVILDPERGRGLGILTIPAEPIRTTL